MDSGSEAWRSYELSIKELIKAFDKNAEVNHNQKVDGRISGAQRQIDVLAKGKVAGLEIAVAVECKRHRRPIDIGVVDQFIGKVLDIGADRGVIYSWSGFTDSAVRRAIGAFNPNIMAIELETPEIVDDLQGVPGYPAGLLVQDEPPQWVEEMTSERFRDFLIDGSWSKFWS